MRYIVTPSFGEKLTLISPREIGALRSALAEIENDSKAALLAKLSGRDENVFFLKRDPFHIFVTFGTDAEGEYVLLADLIVADPIQRSNLTPVPSQNPAANRMLDPRSNVLINPTSNALIDPNRNVMIDPHRNVMIDPRRNVMIDPRRNVMIDVRRNVMIDPRRNVMIDPKRNAFIGPLKNRLWKGSMVYDLGLTPKGFVVRANENVSILFDEHGEYQYSLVKAGDKIVNAFDRDANWSGFFVANGAGGQNEFDLNKKWIGFATPE